MQQDERDIELIDYLEVLVRRKWLIALIVAAGMAGAWLHHAGKPVYYSAGSLIYVAAQSSELQTTELGLPGLTPAFYVKVATADEVRLKMEKLQARILDSLGSPGSSMAMEANIVEETGIELRVRSRVRELPVNLVNAWTDTFLILSQGLSADELGSIYESVQVQFDTASVRLERAEDELETLGSGSGGEALRKESERTIGEMDKIQIQLSSKESQVVEMRGEVEAYKAFVISLEHDGRQIYLLSDSVVATLDVGGLQPVARQLVDFLKLRVEMQERTSRISQALDDHLTTDENAMLLRGDQLSKTIDDYRKMVDSAPTDALIATDSLWGVRQALEALPLTVRSTKAITDEELWRRADGGELTPRQMERLNRLRLVSESVNPAYLEMISKEGRFVAAAEAARHRLLEGKRVLREMHDTLSALSPDLRRIELERQRSEFRNESIKKELTMLEEMIVELQKNYLSARRKVALLTADIALLVSEVSDLQHRRDALQERSMATLDSLGLLDLSRDRLIRSKETLRKTYDRFAQLSEEARIAAQIASTNLRVITRAVTPVGESEDVARPMLLAGFMGLAVSIFLSFLTEYWRRAHRETGQTHEN